MGAVPSGQQYVIRHGDQRATIVEVGGGVREYADGARAVLHPYDVDMMCDGAHGAPLIPWPNRLGDGKYSFEGVDYQVALTEPPKSNAIHGLLRWRPWRATRHEADRVTMAATLFPMQGYPFHLDVEVEYVLDAGGLAVTTIATNAGNSACPYACGQHPYLSPGRGLVDDCQLEFAAATRIATDARQLPSGREAVKGSQFDFSTRRQLGATEVDFAFTDLDRNAGDLFWVRLFGQDGRCVQLWTDRSYPYIEIFTADTLAPSRRRRGLGVEPMSCPPNGLQSGEHVLRLEPGESVAHRWGAGLAP